MTSNQKLHDEARTAGKKVWGDGRCLEAATGDCCRDVRHRPNDFGGSMAKPRSSPRPVTLPASLRALVSSQEAFRSSTRFSSDPGESRTKATSGVSLESKPRRSLGWRSRRCRRTRMSVVRVLPYITSEHESRSSAMWKRKRNFSSIDMDTPTYYLKLQEEFRRLHGLGWTFHRMAEVLGISERTVTAWREELDLPRRPRGRRPRKSRK
jgi:hypothetical protein